MSDATKNRVTDNLQQLKSKGGSRLARIRNILKAAASQTVAEVKQGSGELREIATGTFSAVTQNSAESNTQDPVTSEDLTLRQALQKMSVAFRDKFFAQFKHQARRIDSELAGRYGTQYRTARERLENASEQYRQAVETARASGSDPLQQRQERIDETASVAGASIAQKEHQLKQRLKSILRTQSSTNQ
jgi:DNA anti-recombination protein RmuC